MNQVIECQHCGVTTVVPKGDWLDNICGSCSNDMFAAPEPEKEEMTPTHEENPAGATNTNGANEQSAKSSSPSLYMLKLSSSTAGSFGTWSGTPLPKGDYIEVAVRFSDLQAAHRNGAAAFSVNPDCVLAYDAHVFELREREAKQRREKEELAQRHEEERSIIKNITGMDLVRDDLVVFMTQARRDGEDFQPFLDALQAIDDLDLERAGMTSWDADLDALEEGGDDA